MRTSCIWVIFIACLLASGTALAEDKPLLVMLQGSSSEGLRDLVTRHGGEITHDLHIIDAVGARLSRAQLDEILKSPLIGRHIDDLAMSEPPPEEPREEQTCNVGGAVELDITEEGVSWRLYNKLPKPTALKDLSISWPPVLGPIEHIYLAGHEIDEGHFQDLAPGSMKVLAPQTSVSTVAKTSEIKITFKARTSAASPLPGQNDFSIEANFTDNCSTKLVPAYEDDNLNYSYTRVAGADALHAHGITGKGVTVAVVDSGLWEDKPLRLNSQGQTRVLARYNAITDRQEKEVFDESGHGTHMTSVIAHSGKVTVDGNDTGTFKGIAPDANLVAVKAFDVEGQGDFLDIVRGIQWVVDNKDAYDIRILNLSFAARPRWPYWLDPINQAIMHAWAEGITVVAAAGNEGPDLMTIGSPGNLPYIITVGALTDSWTPDSRDDDYIPDFSSRGPTPTGHIKPDIVAPGGHITGITRPGSSLTKDHPDYILSTGELVMTGSSQASALVSGIVALLLQLEPDLSPDDVKCKLLSSAKPAINDDGLLAYSPFQQGHGQVNAIRAVTLGEKGCGNTELDLKREMIMREHFEGPAIVGEDGKSTLPGLSEMVSSKPSEKGPSKSRKWGVKDHIEREAPPQRATKFGNKSPFDWQTLYLQEKAKIESMSNKPAN